MIAGADFIRFLLSSGGVILAFLAASIWVYVAGRRSAVESLSMRRARTALLALALGLTVFSMYGVEILVARAIVGSLKPFRAADAVARRRTAVVILGSGSVTVEDWDGRRFSLVDRAAQTRVLEAARVYRMIDPAILISSGWDPRPENLQAPTAETMRDALVMLGVPAERIVVEMASRTTREEAVVIAPMLKAQRVEQVILVTGETHMRRALGTFRAAGVDAIPAIAQEFLRGRTSFTEMAVPSEVGLWLGSANTHELLGSVYYRLRGWWK
jgi:uncharacterized SAM-binding protein YcdF (DUF218 family)